MLETLSPPIPDALMRVMKSYRDDPRPAKMDLGVGTFRDDQGETPVLSCVKKAERMLWVTQGSKTYLGPQGDLAFVDLVGGIVFGPAGTGRAIVRGIQTPGGTGAVRLGAELVRLCNPGARVFVGLPTWPNHVPILDALGLAVETYDHADLATREVAFEAMLATIATGRPGDVVLLHGCCHNPTGADLTPEQWHGLAATLRERRMIPLIDLAYQGIGRGLDQDAHGVRHVVANVEEAIVAASCSKNFGLYRERTGALFIAGQTAGAAEVALSRLMELARLAYSMPPDHGAAIVRTILESASLRAEWRAELEEMRLRLGRLRDEVAAAAESAGGDLSFLRRGSGMFAMLDLDPDQVAALRRDHGIYMAETGRVNLAGLRTRDIDRFVEAVLSVSCGVV